MEPYSFMWYRSWHIRSCVCKTREANYCQWCVEYVKFINVIVLRILCWLSFCHIWNSYMFWSLSWRVRRGMYIFFFNLHASASAVQTPMHSVAHVNWFLLISTSNIKRYYSLYLSFYRRWYSSSKVNNTEFSNMSLYRSSGHDINLSFTNFVRKIDQEITWYRTFAL